MSDTTAGNLRRERRFTCLSDVLPGRLVSGHQKKVVKADALDVSNAGIAVMLDEALPVGSDVWLVMGDRTINLEVRYCCKNLGRVQRFRCGLQSKVPWESMRELFVSSGCPVAPA